MEVVPPNPRSRDMVRDLPNRIRRGVHPQLLMLLLLAGCRTTPPSDEAAGRLHVPGWAQDVIWYQIFVERFRNGDPSNDPTAHDIIGVTDEAPPKGWEPTPWAFAWALRRKRSLRKTGSWPR